MRLIVPRVKMSQSHAPTQVAAQSDTFGFDNDTAVPVEETPIGVQSPEIPIVFSFRVKTFLRCAGTDDLLNFRRPAGARYKPGSPSGIECVMVGIEVYGDDFGALDAKENLETVSGSFPMISQHP